MRFLFFFAFNPIFCFKQSIVGIAASTSGEQLFTGFRAHCVKNKKIEKNIKNRKEMMIVFY